MYITNSPSGTVLLFATTLNVGSAPVTLSSTGNSAGGVSSIEVGGSTSLGVKGSYGSFKFFSTLSNLLFIESKALFAVLTGITHWNNYEIGSVFQVRRYPDVFRREMSGYLNFLSVI